MSRSKGYQMSGSMPKSSSSQPQSGSEALLAQKQRLLELLREKARRQAKSSLIGYVRHTFPMFWEKENWHHQLIAEYGERVDRREIDRLMVWAPPRHTKSEILSVRRPAWSIGRDVTRQFIIAAYGDRLARTFSGAVRNILRNQRSQQIFDIQFKTIGNTKWQVKRPPELDNEKDSMIAGGILGPFTGEGATDEVIDDPFKNKQDAYSKLIRDAVFEQYQTALLSRLMPGGTITIQQTRWHEDDLCGRLLKNALKDKRASQWVVICLAATNDDGRSSFIWDTRSGKKEYLAKYRALWPAWQSREQLDQIRIDQGPTFWAAMYQQAPVTAQGTIFKRDAWKYFQQLPVIERLVQVYDTALEEKKENDYSAGIDLVLTQQQAYAITDGWRARVPFPQLVSKVYQRWEEALSRYGRYPERLLIENKGSGISLRQQIEANNLVGEWIGPDGTRRRVPMIPVLGMPAVESKEVRAHGISGYQNAGLCWLPEQGFSDAESPMEDFLDETAVFPKGANDDWVDCFVHGMTYYTRPVQGAEQQEVIVSGEDLVISGDLDEFDEREW